MKQSIQLKKTIPQKGSENISDGTGEATGQFVGGNVYPDSMRSRRNISTQGGPRLKNSSRTRVSLNGPLAKRQAPSQAEGVVGPQPFKNPNFTQEQEVVNNSKFRVALPGNGKTQRYQISGQHWQESNQVLGRRPDLLRTKLRSESQSGLGGPTFDNNMQTIQPQAYPKDKPFQFLSSLQNDDKKGGGGGGYFNGGQQTLEQSLGLTRTSANFAVNVEHARKNSQLKIFTRLDVSKPIPTRGGGGYVIVPEKEEAKRQQTIPTYREQKEFKISRKPSEMNLKTARSRRDGSQMGTIRVSSRLSQQRSARGQEIFKASSSRKHIDVTVAEVRQSAQRTTLETRPEEIDQSFGLKVMSSRPTTAILSESDSKLPYPELFDRTERTFAATFAKFGDLSYFTPIQRIGIYMDYSQRLQRKHLTDLIAYLKTAKHTIKPLDEEQAKTEAGQREYLTHCLFHGSMQLEDAPKTSQVQEEQRQLRRDRRQAMKREFDFPLLSLEDQGTFQYDQVWSQQLMKQVELSTHRFLKYIDDPDSIRNEEVAKFRKEWMQKALDLIPETLLQMYQEQVKEVFQEVFKSYTTAMKTAVLEYILRSPDERKRLHILMLPQPRQTSSLRHIKSGGYSIVTYPGHHQRRLEAASSLKLNLNNYNIVTSSLTAWWNEFQHFDLIQLRNLGQFIKEKEPGKPESAIYAMELDQFFAFQQAYLKKVVGVIKHAWHRGSILIIKRFKWLRTKEDHRHAFQHHKGLAGKAKWTFKGFKAGQEEQNERRWVKDAQWREVYSFEQNDQVTKLQAYFLRAAAVHQNIHLHYFLDEKGLEITDVPGESDFQEKVTISELQDIRDCPVYRDYAAQTGLRVDMRANGYKALDKQVRQELQQSAAQLMERQLRTTIDRTLRTFLNFFRGFVTLEELQREVGEPMRIIRPLVTKEFVIKAKQPELTRAEKANEAAKRKNHALAAQLARRRQEEAKRREEQIKASGLDQPHWENPELKIPYFMDLQDYVCPVFRLDLVLHRDDVEPKSGEVNRSEQLMFSKSDEAIIGGFQDIIDRVVEAFNSFLRPEYCKIAELSAKQLQEEWESTFIKDRSELDVNTEEVNPRFKSAGVLQDFDSVLYNDIENMGPEVFGKFLGRIQVEESQMVKTGNFKQQPLQMPNRTGQPSSLAEAIEDPEPQFIPHHLKATDKDGEADIISVKREILKIIKIHLNETKQVTQVFDQFQCIIKGTLTEKINRFVRAARDEKTAGRITDKDYASLIKELRFYQKLSRQLPTLIFLPMFEVGTKYAKNEIQRRIDSLLTIVFECYETNVIKQSRGICQKYEKVAARLSRKLEKPEDVAEMERYKTDLLLQMGRLQGEIQQNREQCFFLLRADRVLKQETEDLILQLYSWPKKLDEHIIACEDEHETQKQALESTILKLREAFLIETSSLQEKVKEVANWSEPQTYWVNNEKLKAMNQELLEHNERMSLILEQERMIYGTSRELEGFSELRLWFAPFYELGMSIYQLMQSKRSWTSSLLAKIDPFEVEDLVKKTLSLNKRLQRELADFPTTLKVLEAQAHDVGVLNKQLPYIEVLCNQALRPRHWGQIFRILRTNNTALTFGQLDILPLKECFEQLAVISEKAEKEARLEGMLQKMRTEWQSQYLELTSFRDTNIQVLVGTTLEENMGRLEEHRLIAMTIRSSPDVGPLLEEAQNWEHQLNLIQEILDIWVRVQANYLYLEPVMKSEDIKLTLPTESSEFSKVSAAWVSLMEIITPKKLIVELPDEREILPLLMSADDSLESILKSMSSFLEAKRQVFARFYFLSNEELLDALGQSTRPERVQEHLKKCFEGIDSLVFEGQDIAAIVSSQGEEVKIMQKVSPSHYKGQVEEWLLELEKQMESSIKHIIQRCIEHRLSLQNETAKIHEQWLFEWPGQAILVASQNAWTLRVEESLQTQNPQEALQAFFSESQDSLKSIADLVRKQLPKLTRITLGSLIVLEVHAKDVLAQQLKDQTSSLTDFSWISQLRHRFDVELNHVKICLISTEIPYGHEYLGNTTRLVITPLTDRCYRTLVSALSLNLGGAPEGPAGTGKTETTKDLAKVVGVHCLVFNCADGLDAMSMAKFFKGLASSGSWSCFDEFNRIDVEVLSVVAQQILDIQVAKGQMRDKFIFEDSLITLRQRCNIFITMNPGYAGRAELPDNLKALFRPVAMMIPDYAMIGEITLYSYGFQDSRVLASKIVATFRLCSEQLSSQHHYDYGMRAVKSVLSAAGSLKQRCPDTRETQLILKSITNVSLPMFLANDIPLFEGILSDIFTERFVPSSHESLETQLESCSKDQNLQCTQPFMAKVLQLYEMMQVRHGMMLVGPPLAAKTTVYKVLAQALTQMGQVVETHEINPKSLAMSELYGSFDQISHEFSDGVLGTIFRSCASADKKDRRQWIVFDGPIDAEWIENMNTVLDDNKKLCLLNGESILMSENMKLVFEADDLSQASPATVSRCGMVYLEPSMLGASAHLSSWLEQLAPKMKSHKDELPDPVIFSRIHDLFEVFFYPCYQQVTKKAAAPVATSEVQQARSLMNILEALLTRDSFIADLYDPTVRPEEVLARVDMRFIYALIWSMGSSTDEAGQGQFSHHFRKIQSNVHTLANSKIFKLDKSCLLPDGAQNIQEFHIEENRWVSWKETLQRVSQTQDLLKNSALSSKSAMVATTESLKIHSMLELCLTQLIPVLLVGPTGTAKTASVQALLRGVPKSSRVSIQMTFSAKSTSKQTSEILLSKLEKRGRKAVGPMLGKRASVFVDDLNMPSLQKYGAQPAVELLRQLIDHKHWFDIAEKGYPLKEVLDLDFIAAMGPPGGGRNPVTQRLTRHFNLVYICSFREDVLQKIFGKIMEEHCRDKLLLGTPAGSALKHAVTASVSILAFSQQCLKPTPSKSHYLFNMRDLGRVIQGLKMVDKAHLGNDTKTVLRLWVHEVSRVFSDRLTNDEDQRALFSRLVLVARDKLREDLVGSLRNDFGAAAGDPSLMTSEVIFTDILSKRAEVVEVLPEQRPEVNEKLEKVLEEFNSVKKKPLEIVLFKYAVVHLLRVYRIIKMPQGHAFLIGLGGTGRQSLTRLAAYLCDQSLVEIETTKNFLEEQWREQLKTIIIRAGQDGKSSVLMLPDQKIKGSFMLDDVNNLLNSGSVPNLFLPDEKMKIEESLRATAKRAGKMQLYASDDHQDFEDYFVERTQTYLHVVLAMSPIGGALRDRIRNFPSLVNCCTIDWFNKWPDEALESVSAKVLGDAGMQLDQKRKMSRVCRTLQQDAIRLSEEYLEKQRRFMYITPTSYLELLKNFKILLESERQKTSRIKNGYEQGVEKLLSTADHVIKMRQELSEKQPKLVRMTQETEELMKQIETESVEVVQPKQAQIEQEEMAANKIAQEAQAIKQECDDDLSQALPILKKAIEALNTIKSQHINEIKVLGKPPEPIKKVLQAVCIMCQKKVERTPKKDNPKEQEDNWWLTAQKFMNEKNFLQGLLEFDKDHIPDSVLKKIRENFVPDPDFSPQRVEKASFAAKGLCMWILALDQYSKVLKMVAPKKVRAKAAQARYQETLRGLEKKQAELHEIIAQFNALQQRLDDTRQLKEKLQQDIEECQKKIVRAKALLEGLGGEQSRWQDVSLSMDQLLLSLNGDCLLAAATITYLGPVTGDLRQKYLKLWKATIRDHNIKMTSSYSLQSLLGDPVVTRQWEVAGLPTDQFSVDNGIIATRSRRWPLMIDPQGQASKWIRNIKSVQYGDYNPATHRKLTTIKPNDGDFMLRFQNCIPLGLPILLEGVSEELDPVLDNLLEKQTMKKPGGQSIMFGDSLIDYSPDFELFITTKLVNPHFLPEVSTKVALINFGITFDGLKEQLMDIIVQKENAVLDEERQRLIQTNFEFKKTQKEIEQRILDVLQQSEGNILDDELAIETLAQSQQLAGEIATKQEVSKQTQSKLDAARITYSPIAHHCSLMFFLVSKLLLVDVMYQYSLTWFLQLFALALDNFRLDLKRANYDSVDSQAQVEQNQQEVGQQEPSEEVPIDQLKDYFTHQIFSNVCRSLFEKDKLLFTFLLAMTLGQAKGEISALEHEILVSHYEESEIEQTVMEASWLPKARLATLLQMSQLCPVLSAVFQDIQTNQAAWRIVLESANPLSAEYPQVFVDDLLTELSPITKLCLIKALVPGKFIQSISQFVGEQLGEKYLNPPLFNIEKSFADSSAATPMIFILPGADPLQSLVTFAQKKKKFETLKTISLGQGQGVKAEMAIQEARRNGSWVLLQNCHLYPSWMPKLELICDNLATQETGRANLDPSDITNTQFRLWLSSYPSESFPGLVLRNGIKMTNEAPGGFRANLLKSFNSGKSQYYQTQLGERGPIQRMFYNLCMLHAIVQGRKRYGSLGWNCQYLFTNSDLEISSRQLIDFSCQQSFRKSVNTVKCLAGECNYGGRITDQRDMRVMQALLEEYCDPQSQKLDKWHLPPRVESLEEQYTHILSLPLEDEPEIYGLHPNASISKNLLQMRSVCNEINRIGIIEGIKTKAVMPNLNASQVSVQINTVENTEERVRTVCQEILEKLPQKPIDLNMVREQYPVIREKSLNSVLVQELQRFNPLIILIRKTLESLLQTISGEQVASAQTEKMFESVLRNEIPLAWKKVSYPSQRSLGSYIIDLCQRLAKFNKWIEEGPPSTFWMPGFFFPQSFLTSILQDYARKYNLQVDTLTFDFKFESQKVKSAPKDGAYVFGMYLEGASWSPDKMCLEEALPGELQQAMPMMKFTPIQIRKRAHKEDIYQCPIYRTAQRFGTLTTTGHSTNFIIYADLPSGQLDGRHWTKRGVALLCELLD